MNNNNKKTQVRIMLSDNALKHAEKMMAHSGLGLSKTVESCIKFTYENNACEAKDMAHGT
jgi:hypothetical protein